MRKKVKMPQGIIEESLDNVNWRWPHADRCLNVHASSKRVLDVNNVWTTCLAPAHAFEEGHILGEGSSIRRVWPFIRSALNAIKIQAGVLPGGGRVRPLWRGSARDRIPRAMLAFPRAAFAHMLPVCVGMVYASTGLAYLLSLVLPAALCTIRAEGFLRSIPPWDAAAARSCT